MHLKSIGVSNWNGVIFSSVTSKSPSSFFRIRKVWPCSSKRPNPMAPPDPGNERSSPLSLLNLEAIILDDRIAQQPVAQLIQLAPGLGSVFSRHFEDHGFAHPHTFDRFMAQAFHRLLDRGALRIQDRCLGRNKNRYLHEDILKKGHPQSFQPYFRRLKKFAFSARRAGQRMKVRMLVKKAFRLHLGIDLGRPGVRMAQHFLDRPNVRTPISKWVAKEWRKP